MAIFLGYGRLPSTQLDHWHAPKQRPSIDQRPVEQTAYLTEIKDNGYKSVFTNSWLVRQRSRSCIKGLGKHPQKSELVHCWQCLLSGATEPWACDFVYRQCTLTTLKHGPQFFGVKSEGLSWRKSHMLFPSPQDPSLYYVIILRQGPPDASGSSRLRTCAFPYVGQCVMSHSEYVFVFVFEYVFAVYIRTIHTHCPI